MAVMYLEDPGRIAGYIINRLVDSMKATRSALPLSWTRRAILRPRGMQESTSSTLACSLKNAWSFCNCMHFFDECIWCFMHFMHFMHLMHLMHLMQMASWHWCALYSRMICLYVECVLFFWHSWHSGHSWLGAPTGYWLAGWRQQTRSAMTSQMKKRSR